jgi:hypothetical protein
MVVLYMFIYPVLGFLRRSASFIQDCGPGGKGWKLGRGLGRGRGR